MSRIDEIEIALAHNKESAALAAIKPSTIAPSTSADNNNNHIPSPEITAEDATSNIDELANPQESDLITLLKREIDIQKKDMERLRK